ncbi:DUF6809 family protein [Lacrimispora sp.]|uniref:DUF6809 family protein n=1 Tax=Lacrimispora sp. TaxID=2719234 RepID=UPI00289EC152|nr:DUF6809 family protein [Lacrimispora sp.]
MKSILCGLYNGDIIPWERRNPQSEQQLELLRKIEDEERYFMAKMSLDDCQRFQELSHMHMELSTAGEDNLFSYAFSLGMLLTMEVMKETDGIFND